MRSVSMSLSLEGFLLVAPRMHLDSRPLLRLGMVVKTFLRKARGKMICSNTPWLNCSSGLSIRERNYLDVYPYDKWSDKELPDFEEGATFVPSVCELRDGTTSKPSLLTEADLVGIMDKNGIGTDATIAQHIDTIINREYVVPRMEGSVKYLVPSTFGIGLVKGYNDIEFERSLSKPQLRREVREIAHQ